MNHFGHSINYHIAEAMETELATTISESGIVMEKLASLACNHEEADTRLIRHVEHMCEICQDGNIIIRSSDKDVLVILLAHVHNLPAHLGLDACVSTNNSKWYIDISKLAENMGSE